ncbi:NAD-dependent epimerase/dehydratase family protein [Herbiconiux liukaitaii]|uniref:NAD-dependent epimerase/dehydratase family protein n=1 Tax=Herbiconiux liukaitaii TaxID=3342799 RepID=UPI0035B79D87
MPADGGARALKVVVTGGCGFIGSNLCRLLAADPQIELVVLDDFSVGDAGRLDGLDLTIIEGSVLDPQAIDAAFAGADAVVHLAAVASVQESVENPLRVLDVNVTGTALVLEAARRSGGGSGDAAGGGAHVILASSSSVYGSDPTLPKHEGLLPRTESPYGVSKLAAEAYALTWQRVYGLPVLAFRFFNVFGPRQQASSAYPAVVPAFLERAIAGEPLVVYGTGEQSRDFTYVDSVCSVIADAVRRRVVSDTPVDLGFGVRTSLLELIGAIETAIGHPVETVFDQARRGDVLHSQAEGAEMARLFPALQPVSLERGLAATVEWMRSR